MTFTIVQEFNDLHRAVPQVTDPTRDWLTYIMSRPHAECWKTLFDIAPQLNDLELARIVPTLFLVIAERKRKYLEPLFKRLKSAHAAIKFFMFHPADYAVFNGLPDPFTVYRGCAELESGLSWTLSPGVAQRFADIEQVEGDPAIGIRRRKLRVGRVIERRVKKSEVLFFTDRFKQQEAVMSEPTPGGWDAFVESGSLD